MTASPEQQLAAFKIGSESLAEHAFPSTMYAQDYVKPGLLAILDSSQWAGGTIPAAVRSSYLLYLAQLSKKALAATDIMRLTQRVRSNCL